MVSVSGIMSGVSTMWRYGKRALEVAPELAFGTSSQTAGSAMKAAKGSVFNKAQAGWQAIEKAGSGSFFKGFLNNCKNFFPDAIKAYKSGSAAQGLKGGFKSLFKNLGSKMPFLMSAMMIFMEAPNVYTAVKEKGIFQGAKEVLKFGIRMTTAGLGSAIGAALPIPLGSLIGWSVGEWIASRIVGKSYTEQKAEKEEIINELMGQNRDNPQQVEQQRFQAQQPYTPNPYWMNNSQVPSQQQPSFNGNISNPFDYNQYKIQSMPYSNDIMMQKMPFNTIA